MNRRGFLTSSTALLATTMLCPVKTLAHNAVLASARRAQIQAIANELMKGLMTPNIAWFKLTDTAA